MTEMISDVLVGFAAMLAVWAICVPLGVLANPKSRSDLFDCIDQWKRDRS